MQALWMIRFPPFPQWKALASWTSLHSSASLPGRARGNTHTLCRAPASINKSSPSESAGLERELLKRVGESAQHLCELEPPTVIEPVLTVLEEKALWVKGRSSHRQMRRHEESMTRARRKKPWDCLRTSSWKNYTRPCSDARCTLAINTCVRFPLWKCVLSQFILDFKRFVLHIACLTVDTL